MTSKRFNNAYNALVEAYFNEELKSGNCTYCAVGNIVKDSAIRLGIENSVWSRLFTTSCGEQTKYYKTEKGISTNPTKMKAVRLIKDTGYTVDELAAVEFAFETNTKFHHSQYQDLLEQDILEDQYNGLKAVVEVLLSFEEQKVESEEFVSKFKQHPKLVGCSTM